MPASYYPEGPANGVGLPTTVSPEGAGGRRCRFFAAGSAFRGFLSATTCSCGPLRLRRTPLGRC